MVVEDTGLVVVELVTGFVEELVDDVALLVVLEVVLVLEDFGMFSIYVGVAKITDMNDIQQLPEDIGNSMRLSTRKSFLTRSRLRHSIRFHRTGPCYSVSLALRKDYTIFCNTRATYQTLAQD